MAGFWLVSFPLGFHGITRHDGVLSVLRDECGLGPSSCVADLGSGTGALTAQILDFPGSIMADNACKEAEFLRNPKKEIVDQVGNSHGSQNDAVD